MLNIYKNKHYFCSIIVCLFSIIFFFIFFFWISYFVSKQNILKFQKTNKIYEQIQQINYESEYNPKIYNKKEEERCEKQVPRTCQKPIIPLEEYDPIKELNIRKYMSDPAVGTVIIALKDKHEQLYKKYIYAEKLIDFLIAKDQTIETLNTKLEQNEQQLSETNNELGETKTKLEQTEQQLSKTNNELEQNEQQLSETNNELGETKTKLEQTEQQLSKTNNELGETKTKLEQTEQQLSKT
ncbi:hypothetical protein OYV_07970, partial ['Chrysanthemum coronarium' phytoplasma]